MGKKLVKNEKEIKKNILMPNENEILGMVDKNLGYTRMRVKCQDGNRRLCRVRGKMKKRNWVREGDIVLVSPWDFQSDEKGDARAQSQSDWLRNQGLPELK